jgi:hypothetical protein
MHNAAAAEWILSLVAPPDRAASTVGDLVEEASSRGTLWFWSCVLRTAGSHLWHDLTVSPLGMLRLAVWGFLTYWFVGLLFLTFVSKVAIDFFGHMDLHDGFTVAPGWVHPIAFVLLYTAVPCLVGWIVARSSDGREMAATFAVVALFAAFYVLALYGSSIQLRRMGRPYPFMEHAFAVDSVRALSMLAGAILFRRRHKTSHSRVLSNPTT